MRVESFIKNFNKSEEVVKCFTEGCCYWFAVILKERFPAGEIYYNTLNHFVFKHNDDLYDITGNCTDKWDNEYLYKWDDYRTMEQGSTHLQSLIQDSILKL